MITESTVRHIAGLMVREHALRAPGIAADVVQALDWLGDAEAHDDWLRITRAVWRTLHGRGSAAEAQSATGAS